MKRFKHQKKKTKGHLSRQIEKDTTNNEDIEDGYE